MNYKRKYTILEIVNIVYFLAAIFVLACKMGLFFKLELRERIFDVFYYWCSTVIFALSILTLIGLIVKSKKQYNSDDVEECSRDTISVLNMAIISFDFLISLIGTLNIEVIAFQWLQITLYINLIVIIIDMLVYYYIRGRIVSQFDFYSQKEVINKYFVYAIIASLLLAVVVPNLMIHQGVMAAI